MGEKSETGGTGAWASVQPIRAYQEGGGLIRGVGGGGWRVEGLSGGWRRRHSPMKDSCRMDVHQASDHLIEEELKMLIGHPPLVHLDHVVEI